MGPEPYAPHDTRSKYQSIRNLLGRTLRLLRARHGALLPEAAELARRLLDGERRILEIADPFLNRRITGLRIRVHGDYHLGQLLYTGKDFVIIDLHGVHSDSLAERRRKHTALGMWPV